MNYEKYFDALTELVTGMCIHTQTLRMFTEDHDGVKILVAMPHTADHAKLVGRRGDTIKAMQFLTNKAAVRLQCRIAFRLDESFLGEPGAKEPFAFNPDFDRQKFERLLAVILEATSDPVPRFSVAYIGQGLLADIHLPRESEAASLASALNSVFMPYCYSQGRMSRIRLESPPRYYAKEFAPGRWHVIAPRGLPIYDDAPHGKDKPLVWKDEDAAMEHAGRCNSEQP